MRKGTENAGKSACFGLSAATLYALADNLLLVAVQLHTAFGEERRESGFEGVLFGLGWSVRILEGEGRALGNWSILASKRSNVRELNGPML